MQNEHEEFIKEKGRKLSLKVIEILKTEAPVIGFLTLSNLIASLAIYHGLEKQNVLDSISRAWEYQKEK